MPFSEDLTKKAQQVAGAAAEKAKDLAGTATEMAKAAIDTAKMNMEILSEQREIEKNYRAIGEWFVSEFQGEVPDAVKDVVAAAIKGGTDAVVLCHNHPNGVALPSMEDMEATGSIARALGLVNIHLLDHFILTDTECFSMRDAGRLPIYDFKTGTLFWP